MKTLRWLCLLTGLGWPLAQAAGQGAACEAQSAPQRQTVVELYTSEGCDSCPPADRWLSGLKGQPGVLAAAFHVDYWDRLGWVDRFASARYTRRQAEQQPHTGARFSYTPQVLVDGQDWRLWPRLPHDGGVATVQIVLRRSTADRIEAGVQPLAGAPPRLGLWWVRLEDGHVSAVRAGENAGATLHHDHVVRDFGELPAWRAEGYRQWAIESPVTPEKGHAARWLVVVTDAASGRPLQAVDLGC